MSRADLDGLVPRPPISEPGLVWAVVEGEGWRSPVAKFLSAEEISAANEALGASEGDVVLLVADEPLLSAEVLGELRRRLGERLGLIDPEATTHLDRRLAPARLGRRRGIAGTRTTTPSPRPTGRSIPPIRALPGPRPTTSSGTDGRWWWLDPHQRPRVQRKVSRRSESTSRRPEERFGSSSTRCATARPARWNRLWARPIVALLHGTKSIRDVIAFPKTASGGDPLTGARAPVDDRQLRDLGISIRGGGGKG